MVDFDEGQEIVDIREIDPLEADIEHNVEVDDELEEQYFEFKEAVQLEREDKIRTRSEKDRLKRVSAVEEFLNSEGEAPLKVQAKFIGERDQSKLTDEL